jgi:hypothetical protein
LARERYAESESSLATTKLPVFVTVLKRTLSAPAKMTAEIARLPGSIADVLERHRTCAHVEYAPAASGSEARRTGAGQRAGEPSSPAAEAVVGLRPGGGRRFPS